MAHDSLEPISRHDQASDEAEALRTLDDTTIRPLPDDASPWPTAQTDLAPTSGQDQSAAPEPQRLTLSKAQLGAVVAAVAMVSFVAGGITARLGSQVPLLMTRQSATHEASLTLDKPVVPVAEQESPASDEPHTDEASPIEATPNPPSYDTGYDDTAVPQTDQDGGGRRWTWDEQDDRSPIADDTSRVTLDTYGYSFTFDLDDLVGDDTDDSHTHSFEEDGSQDTSPWKLDSGTGYDHEEERDSYRWHHHSSTGAIQT